MSTLLLSRRSYFASNIEYVLKEMKAYGVRTSKELRVIAKKEQAKDVQNIVPVCTELEFMSETDITSTITQGKIDRVIVPSGSVILKDCIISLKSNYYGKYVYKVVDFNIETNESEES